MVGGVYEEVKRVCWWGVRGYVLRRCGSEYVCTGEERKKGRKVSVTDGKTDRYRFLVDCYWNWYHWH